MQIAESCEWNSRSCVAHLFCNRMTCSADQISTIYQFFHWKTNSLIVTIVIIKVVLVTWIVVPLLRQNLGSLLLLWNYDFAKWVTYSGFIFLPKHLKRAIAFVSLKSVIVLLSIAKLRLLLKLSLIFLVFLCFWLLLEENR